MSITDNEVEELIVHGEKKLCPICSNDKFFIRRTLMNTMGMTFFGIEWLNKEAYNYICTRCNYIFWFLKHPPKLSEKEIQERKKEIKKRKKENKDGWWIN